ncbi:neprilysin-4-like, partial [Parasteatoda tepidariorum]|uniref:neprilysin-4-like n=1 Tax=Parasteatoda tepidariorum TaxID=114398 RepID=UPI0039BCD551
MREIWRPLIGDAVHDTDIVSTCKSNLAVIISALNQASPRMSARYVLWRMLTQIVQYLGNDFRNLQLYYTGYVPFWKHFYDKNWQSCADFIRQELGIASFKFLEEYGFITGQQLENIKNVFTKLKTEILQITRANSRLSRLTKKLFQNKLKTMQLDFGYPEVVRNRSVIDIVYENLQTIDDYFLNVMNVKKFKTRYFFNRLWYSNSENVVSEISLEESPLGVSFSYDYKTNKVRLDGSSFWFP